MTKSAPSPITKETGVVTFRIEVEGKPLSDTAIVLSISSKNAMGHEAIASIEISTIPDSPIDNHIVEELALGKNVSIFIGYEVKNSLIFSGQIKAQSLQLDHLKQSLIIDCKSSVVLKEDIDVNSDPVLTLTYGQDIYSFERKIISENSYLNRGKISFPGSALAVPNKEVVINGLPSDFDGLALISAVSHVIKEGDWLTTIDIGI